MKLPGYQIGEKIHQGEQSIIYRGQRESDGLPAIIKILSDTYPVVYGSAKLRQEFEMTQRIDSPHCIKSYALLPYNNAYALVLEDCDGSSLRESLAAKRWFDVAAFLPIAIALTDGLGAIHQQQIIHKDIKPGNIVVNEHTGAVKIIDFSISSFVAQESQDLLTSEGMEGTLTYMSPEQTGRINRSVDSRTDLYALGIVFYEMLTGFPPFVSDDKLEVLHAHLAKMPDPPHVRNPYIPPVLSAIILKLLAKSAEDRYVSALGVKHDLTICLEQLTQQGRIADFSIGAADVSQEFRIPQGVYGREPELATLRAALAPADAEGAGPLAPTRTLLVVTGDAGMGKSALIHELRRQLTPSAGYFVTGKADEFTRNIPYAPLIQAFQELVRRALTESQTRIIAWKNRILTALGANAGVITAVLPDLELILGVQPTPLELGAVEAQHRFNTMFQEFVRVLAQPEHPLRIFVDDVHWADLATLHLLRTLLCSPDIQHFVVIAAYRERELGPDHPLTTMLQALTQKPVRMTPLPLGPLPRAALLRLMADALHADEAAIQALTDVILEKTGGNPFFVRAILTALHQQGAFAFDVQQRRWRWDETRIRQIEITANVAELMAARLDSLPAATQQALQVAACLGDQFEVATLVAVAHTSYRATLGALADALAAGVIAPIGDTARHLKLLQIDLADASLKKFEFTFRFVHHRVQQAAYKLLPEQRQQTLHLDIGRCLHAALSESERDERLFDLAAHFNLARPLLTDPQERVLVAALNLQAGRKSKASTAYHAARALFAAGMHLLPADRWQSHYDLTSALHIEHAETSYLAGQPEAARAECDALFTLVRTPLEQVRLYEIVLRSYVAQKRFQECLATGMQALALLGVRLPEKPTKTDVAAALLRARLAIGRKGLADLRDLPAMHHPSLQRAMQIMMLMAAIAYQANPDLLVVIGLTMTRLSVRCGNTAYASFGYIMYALVLNGVLGQVTQGVAYAQLGLEVMDRFHARELHGRNHCLYNIFFRHWQEPLQNTFNPLLEFAEASKDVGDPEYQTYQYFFYCQARFVAGGQLDALDEEIRRYQRLNVELNQEIAQNVLAILWQTVLNLRGAEDDPTRLIGSQFNSALPESLPSASSRFYTAFYQAMLNFLFDHPAEAQKYIQQAKPYLEAVIAMNVVPLFHFYAALIELAQAPQKTLIPNLNARRSIRRHLRKLRTWARYAPENQAHRVLLVQAEWARVTGRTHDAIRAYEQAITVSQQHGYTSEMAVASERAARFYQALGNEEFFRRYIGRAYTAYLKWGALAKTAALAEAFPFVLDDPLVVDATETGTHTTRRHSTRTTGAAAETLDLATVMKAAQTISSEISCDKLLANLMHVVMENAGAQSGLLLRQMDEVWRIAACGSVEPAGFQMADGRRATDRAALLPESLLHYVVRTKERVVLHDAVQDGQFGQDAYIRAHAPKSILCLPLINQGQTTAVLYLENNLTTGAFTARHLEVLQLLSAQMAISLDNAYLYSTLQASEKKYRTLFEESKDVIFITMADGQIIDISPACENLLGIPRDEALRLNVAALYAYPEELARFQRVIAEYGVLKDFEITLKRRDGRELDAIVTATVRYGEQGKILGYQGILRDISVQKQAEQERFRALALEKEKEAAEMANQAKSTFLAHMSHELRTPLNGILGYAQILRRRPDLEPTLKDGLDTIYESGNHLLTLINDILDLSKIEARKMELNVAELYLPAFLDGIVGIIRMRAQQKDVRFQHEFSADLPSGILADEKRLRQVLLNLLGNAVKFTDSGGTVICKVLDLRLQILENNAPQSQIKNLKFEVSDTGIGMAPEQVQHIFQPFEQVSEIRRRAEGTGLGLTISRQLVELMGGTLHVESALGQGSRFWFEASFPMFDAQAFQPPVTRGEMTGYTGPRRTILVVDDKLENRRVLVDLLEPLGFVVAVSSDGQDGVRQAETLRPDLILLDLVMPIMDGFEAARIIRTLPEIKETPIVAVSASTFGTDQERSLLSGCNAFLPKPIDVQHVLAVLTTYLHVPWTYAAIPADPAAATAAEQQAEMVHPPLKELQTLHELVRYGNMDLIQEHADRLEALDDRYRSFTQVLRQLAQNYEDRQLLRIIEDALRHSETTP